MGRSCTAHPVIPTRDTSTPNHTLQSALASTHLYKTCHDSTSQSALQGTVLHNPGQNDTKRSREHSSRLHWTARHSTGRSALTGHLTRQDATSRYMPSHDAAPSLDTRLPRTPHDVTERPSGHSPFLSFTSQDVPLHNRAPLWARAHTALAPTAPDRTQRPCGHPTVPAPTPRHTDHFPLDICETASYSNSIEAGGVCL